MFTYDEAAVTCQEHSFLVGTQITKGFRVTGTIEAVVPAPLDGINQHRFLKEYKEHRNATKALNVYQGYLYTVLLVGCSIRNSKEVFTMELDKYLAEHLHTA
jgi:hypothetical protein